MVGEHRVDGEIAALARMGVVGGRSGGVRPVPASVEVSEACSTWEGTGAGNWPETGRREPPRGVDGKDDDVRADRNDPVGVLCVSSADMARFSVAPSTDSGGASSSSTHCAAVS